MNEKIKVEKLSNVLHLEAAAKKRWGELNEQERRAYVKANPKTRMRPPRDHELVTVKPDRSGHLGWSDGDVEHWGK